MENVHLGPADPYRVRLMLIVSTESRLYQQRVLMARERRMATHLGRGQGKLGPAPLFRVAPPPHHLESHWRSLPESKLAPRLAGGC